MKKSTKRANYWIKKELKERIKKDSRYKNLSYFIREAVHDMIKNPIEKGIIHELNKKIENMELIKTTVLLFVEDVDNLVEIKSNDETYQYDTTYLLSLIVLNYAIKEKLDI